MPTKLKDAPDKLKPFLFHGVDISVHPVEAEGNCPFCHKPGHFGIKTPTGQWRCVRCDAHGNIFNFLAQLLKDSLAATPDAAYARLSADRSLSTTTSGTSRTSVVAA